MGCSPSTSLPHKIGKETLSCTNVFLETQNSKYQQNVTSPGTENGGDESLSHDRDNNNTVEKNSPKNSVHTKQSEENTDSAKIIPVISSEETTSLSNNSPLNVHMFTKHYVNSEASNGSLHHSKKSVLKTQHKGKRQKNMLSNRPLKTVKFLDSVTVVTVY